jgi:hypothetical protein
VCLAHNPGRMINSLVRVREVRVVLVFPTLVNGPLYREPRDPCNIGSCPTFEEMRRRPVDSTRVVPHFRGGITPPSFFARQGRSTAG